MKRLCFTITFILFVGIYWVNAQDGLKGINYQAVARNTNGTVLSNQAVKVKISILGGTANGPVQYLEQHSVNTNQLGLFTLQLGKGTPSTGTFTGVPWQNANQYLKVELALGGGAFNDLGTTQLMSVPFALFAATGNPGPQGIQGPIGLQGIQGVQGPSGANGLLTGPAGGDLSGNYPNPLIGNDKVTTVKILDGSVTLPKLAAGVIPVIPAALPPNGAAGGDLSGAYPSPLIGNDKVTTVKILDGSVTLPKLAPGVIPVIPAALPPNGAAGGDLSGTYPNPAVAKLQSIPVDPTAPVLNNVLKFNGVSWAPGSIGGGGFVLPFIANENNAGTLFSINNIGIGTSVEGTSASTNANITAVRGVVTSINPGSFSSAIRGINNGTSGFGIGIWGSQAGSGWGVYGDTPGGIGVYGNSSGNGVGVLAKAESGTGLLATSFLGAAAELYLTNLNNSSNVMNVSTIGNGSGIEVKTSGGYGVNSTSTQSTGVHGTTTVQTAAGIIGDNTGGGEAVVGRTTSDIAGAVVGRNDGGGYGVHGFISSNATGTGVGVFGKVGQGGSKGRAGRFENVNGANLFNTLEVYTNSDGQVIDNKVGNAASFLVNNANSVSAGVRAEVNTIFANYGAAAVFGVASGTGGFAGLFHSSNSSGGGPAIVAITDGFGNAITASAEKNGNGVETTVNGTGNSLYAWVPSFGMGRAGRFENFNSANGSDVITSTTIGYGAAGSFKVDNTKGTSAAVKGEVNSQFSNFGTAGIYGVSSGTGGFGGLFYASNPLGNAPAVVAIARGNGNSITANASALGDGVESTVDGTGNAFYGWVSNFSNGKAARFVNFNNVNVNPVITVETHSSGNLAVFKAGNPGTVNVARIDVAGKGFFNGGTQAGGADIAESFDVSGNILSYEPGDILVISTCKDRTVEKSTGAYSNLVAGVYATKPGVLLTEEHIDSDIKTQVPMGVIGVLPTKVCMEGGAISRGDLLVTSSCSGVAMKADPDKVKIGQVLGKALEAYGTIGVGKIKVLVSLK